MVQSRIGLSAPCDAIGEEDDLFSLFCREHADADVIIADECQFFTAAHVDGLRRIVDERDIPVMCFGLRADFLCHLFTGSKRLFEVADSIAEIKTICSCGAKAIINARLDKDMNVVTEGDQVLLGGNDLYVAMCHKCWKRRIREQAKA